MHLYSFCCYITLIYVLHDCIIVYSKIVVLCVCLLAEKSSLAAAAAVYIPTCLQSVKLCLGDPIDFMSWFLNALHTALNGSRKLSSSVINKTFRGESFS